MTFTVHTLGCKVNACESAAISESLIAKGYEPSAFGQPADVYIVNSCAVTSISVKKARYALSRCKRDNPECITVLCGCFPQAYPEDASTADADIITGNSDKAKIADMLEEFISKRTKRFVVSPMTREFDEAASGTDLDRTRAFIKIEDGCDRFCTYCIIPTARGRVRSRKLCEISRLARLAAESGHKEIVLTGINLSCYGQDLGHTLSDAVKAADVDGIERIRLGSLEPDMMTDDEIAGLRECKKLCPHFHLSLQSGCDATLKRMRRRYSSAEYEEVCRKLRESFPSCSITTDIMVGFAGESDEEFTESIAFAEKIGFAKIHVFPYSIRLGTVAAMHNTQVAPQVKSARARTAEKFAATQEQKHFRSLIGSEHTVLIEKSRSNEYSNGYTESYIPIRIYEVSLERHSLVRVRITAAEKDFCKAEIVR